MLIFFQLLIQSCLKKFKPFINLIRIILPSVNDHQKNANRLPNMLYGHKVSNRLWTPKINSILNQPWSIITLPSVVDSVCVQWKYTVCVQKKMLPHSDLVIPIFSQYRFPPHMFQLPHRNPPLIWLEQKLSTKYNLSDETTLNLKKWFEFMTDTFWKIKLQCSILIISKVPATVISGYERPRMKSCARY